ncbi:MAG: hypothetical protein IT529_17600 [Burkholderiales bacterium]|nr:hypothetical protein [Burkholderiales bacterium]
MSRTFTLALIVAVLPGCAVQTYGGETVGAGGSAVLAGSAVAASVSASGARFAFISGTPVPVGAPGGQLTVASSSAGGAVLAGVLLAEFLSAIGAVAPPGAKPLPPDTRIMHTCSCYGYQPGGGEASGVGRGENGATR